MKLTQEQIERIRSLESARGTITPDAVIADARAASSPLHGLFEWNRNAAALAHWRHVAREIIGAVEIVVQHESVTIKAPCYVRDPEADGQGYRRVAELRRDPKLARESLVYTLEVAAGHLRRALDLAGPLGLSAEVDALLDQIAGVQRSISAAA